MSTISKKEQEEAKNHLLELVKPGDTVYTSLKHVSRSGMYRVIDLFIMRDNKPLRISYWASVLLEGYDRRHEGCKAGGCGMDMGFHLVYNLGWSLFPDGFGCIGKGCPSNDHTNGDRDYTIHGDGESSQQHEYPDIGNNHWHKGGYALRQEWL